MRVLALVVVLALTACGREATTYPPEYELNFMTACEAQSSLPGLCGCTWARIEAEIPPNDFVALERLPGPEREAHPLTAQIAEYALACTAELTPAPAGEPAPAP